MNENKARRRITNVADAEGGGSNVHREMNVSVDVDVKWSESRSNDR